MLPRIEKSPLPTKTENCAKSEQTIPQSRIRSPAPFTQGSHIFSRGLTPRKAGAQCAPLQVKFETRSRFL